MPEEKKKSKLHKAYDSITLPKRPIDRIMEHSKKSHDGKSKDERTKYIVQGMKVKEKPKLRPKQK